MSSAYMFNYYQQCMAPFDKDLFFVLVNPEFEAPTKKMRAHKGMFQSDASLLTEEGPADIVDEMLVPGKFFVEFGQSMKSFN
ncbi:hypothetical protein IFM89_024532 [Coptis chinensis]|uniref:Uncharacterized protein n=1 Tax=Coptis chinensis TaxID=261450 RepID=A0A835HNA8_9MAGN|nr:hypothetical protein IFM89_024532 [Coptis chinensis]